MAKETVISLFTGAMGLDLGFEQAGFEVRVAVENNQHAAKTIHINRPTIPVIERNIELVSTSEILESAGLKVGQCTVVTGGPSCQSFSTAGRRKSLSDPRGGLFHHFLRVINEAKPRFFVMENVSGILSAAIKHRPLNKRGPGNPPLTDEEELGSALKLMLNLFEDTGYYVIFDLLNAADYGTPQTRKRVVFIGSRDGEKIHIPIPTHNRNGENGMKKWTTLGEVTQKLVDPQPEYSPLPKGQAEFIKNIPAGGNWRDLPENLQEGALGGAYYSWGGRGGFLRRLSWDEPAPALTTCPSGKATMLCHPELQRPLSIIEYRELQQFPAEWEFEGSLNQKYTQIGNAVPVGLAKAIASSIADTINSGAEKNVELLGRAFCANADLAKRLTNRPRTMLNPLRMRPEDNAEKTKKWLENLQENRREEILVVPEASYKALENEFASVR